MDCEAKRNDFNTWSEFASWRADCLHNNRWPTLHPTPPEIRMACLAIQAGWDARTERERAGCFASRPVEFEMVAVVA
jgi:hypothetical protein